MGTSGDIFSQLSSPPPQTATPQTQAAAPQASGDIFDQVSKSADIPPAEHSPDAANRYWKSLGITSQGQSVKDAFLSDVNYIKTQPGAAAKELATSPVTGYANAAEEQYHRAADHFHRGDYTGGLIHSLYYLLSPVGGAQMGRAADQSETGDIAGAAGTMTLPALTAAAGSPATRGAINAGRTAVADTLENNAGKIGRTAAVGVGAKLGGAAGAFVGDTLSPGAASLVKRLGAAARPGEAPIQMLPLTRQVVASKEMKDFLNSPGIEGEVTDRAHQGGLPQGPHQLLLKSGTYEMPQSVSTVNQNAETAAAQEGIDQQLFRKIYWNHTEPAMRDFEFARRIQHSMNAQDGEGAVDLSLAKIKKTIQQPQDSAPYLDAAHNTLGKEAKFSDVQDLAKRLQNQDEDMAHLLMKSIERVKDFKSSKPAIAGFPAETAEQGGHAGQGVTSIEELSRPGVNYVVSKGGQVTYHGKQFAPESVPSGGAHVTVLPDGKLRVNSGMLSDSQKAALERALKQ